MRQDTFPAIIAVLLSNDGMTVQMVHLVTQHTEFIKAFFTFQIPYGYMLHVQV